MFEEDLFVSEEVKLGTEATFAITFWWADVTLH